MVAYRLHNGKKYPFFNLKQNSKKEYIFLPNENFIRDGELSLIINSKIYNLRYPGLPCSRKENLPLRLTVFYENGELLFDLNWLGNNSKIRVQYKKNRLLTSLITVALLFIAIASVWFVSKIQKTNGDKDNSQTSVVPVTASVERVLPIPKINKISLSDFLRDNPIYFRKNTVELMPGENVKIEGLIEIVNNEAGSFDLIIAGHSNPTGNSDLELQLSKERAISIQELIRGRIGDRIGYKIVYFGSDKPVIRFITSEEEEQLNRRVELLMEEK